MAVPLLFFNLPLHVVEHPVPDDHEIGDDDVGKQACAEEGHGDDDFGIHHRHLQASAATLSAQVSTLVRIASSSYEARLTRSLPNVII